MKKKLYLCLVIFLITMPTIITMNCVKDGFMCQFALNCCNKLCNAYGFCHRGYKGTNLDVKEILERNPHLRPGAQPIQLNPAIFDLPPNLSPYPPNPYPNPNPNPNPGMLNAYPNAPSNPGAWNPAPWNPTGYNNPNAAWNPPGNNNPNTAWNPPGNNNPNAAWNPSDNNNPNAARNPPGNNNPDAAWNPATVNPFDNPPPNPNLPVDVYDKPDPSSLRLHHF